MVDIVLSTNFALLLRHYVSFQSNNYRSKSMFALRDGKQFNPPHPRPKARGSHVKGAKINNRGADNRGCSNIILPLFIGHLTPPPPILLKLFLHLTPPPPICNNTFFIYDNDTNVTFTLCQATLQQHQLQYPMGDCQKKRHSHQVIKCANFVDKKNFPSLRPHHL